jgi:hypothetical protein
LHLAKAMEEPVFGLCPLCLQQKQLEKSHYLGRALHLLSQTGGEAVFMTPQRIELSARQIWAHLLCGDREDILAKNESYAHQWINRKERFPLLERLNVAAPQDAARLDGISLNRAAFEVWKRLEESGAKITGHENCQIVPSPDIESKLARAVEKGFAQKPKGGK